MLEPIPVFGAAFWWVSAFENLSRNEVWGEGVRPLGFSRGATAFA
ncbi:hypothetical protein RISK_002231 [Rhodopirellula islandica]|uniref:Uncharacterized protein n=1 Tax=Rhodopirellula islandica TaxID=595434 RepID=A0A0J1EJ93_RHOIS|nr:hypothetical protein RISK_002231 [Rhodopirellula islandica]